MKLSSFLTFLAAATVAVALVTLLTGHGSLLQPSMGLAAFVRRRNSNSGMRSASASASSHERQLHVWTRPLQLSGKLFATPSESRAACLDGAGLSPVQTIGSTFSSYQAPEAAENSLHVLFVSVNTKQKYLERMQRVLCDVASHTAARIEVHLLVDDAIAKEGKANWFVQGLPSHPALFYNLYSYEQYVRRSGHFPKVCVNFGREASMSSRGYLSGTCIYLSKLTLFELLPSWVPAVIVLDTDIRVVGDLAELWQQLAVMRRKGALMGVVPEAQPEYHVAGFGIQGYNGGVQLHDLAGMRANPSYLSLIQGTSLDNFPASFRFHAFLGDQTVYSLWNLTAPGLVHDLPCGFNRQLCRYWYEERFVKQHGFTYDAETWRKDYAHMFDCPAASMVIIHGNCADRRPAEELDGSPEEVKARISQQWPQ